MGANVQGLQYAGLQGIAKKIEITIMVNQMENEMGTREYRTWPEATVFLRVYIYIYSSIESTVRILPSLLKKRDEYEDQVVFRGLGFRVDSWMSSSGVPGLLGKISPLPQY